MTAVGALPAKPTMHRSVARTALTAAQRQSARTATLLRSTALVTAGTGLAVSCSSGMPRRAMCAGAPPASPGGVLGGEDDFYGGLLVDGEAVAACGTEEAFRSTLDASMLAWRGAGRRGIWLRVPARVPAFVPIALAKGFELHHAEAGHVMLTYFFPAEDGVTPNTLPPYTTHTAGVGAVVLNEQREILVVQERTGPAANSDFWKYPTGMVDAGEDAAQAAVREVYEETGVRAEVVSLVGFRETHNNNNPRFGHMAGKSNLFFVFLCRPLSSKIEIQESEIAAAQWMAVDEYMKNVEKRMPHGTVYQVLNEVAIAAADGRAPLGFEMHKLGIGFRSGTDLTYLPADWAPPKPKL